MYEIYIERLESWYKVETRMILNLQRCKINTAFSQNQYIDTKNVTFKLIIWNHNLSLNIKRKCYI